MILPILPLNHEWKGSYTDRNKNGCVHEKLNLWKVDILLITTYNSMKKFWYHDRHILNYNSVIKDISIVNNSVDNFYKTPDN